MNDSANIKNRLTSKTAKTLLTITLAGALLVASGHAAFSGDVHAQESYNAPQGGFSGPGPTVVTVEQAKDMRDDSHVSLRGYIIQSLDGKHYLFKDDTGTIQVEISPKHWAGQTIAPEDLVEISGELDKEWSKTEVEVYRITRQ